MLKLNKNKKSIKSGWAKLFNVSIWFLTTYSIVSTNESSSFSISIQILSFLFFEEQFLESWYQNLYIVHWRCCPSDKINSSKCQDLCVCCHHNINPYIGRVEIWSSREFYICLNIHQLYFFHITFTFTSSCLLYLLTLLLT